MVLELLKIILPALLVFLAGYLAIERLLRNEANRRKVDITISRQKVSTPIRLQAYERIVLYLERISPESLLLRLNQPGLTSKKLQALLLSTIREEWEHNLSQQLYISSKAWGLVKNAKSNVIKLISICADKVDANESAMILSKLILDNLVEMENHPTEKAIEFLKNEVNELF